MSFRFGHFDQLANCKMLRYYLIVISIGILMFIMAIAPLYFYHSKLFLLTGKMTTPKTSREFLYDCFLDVTSLDFNISIDEGQLKLQFISLSKQASSLLLGRSNHAQFVPQHCKPSKTIAIIIPYRDRLKHLQVLLARLHSMLQKQLVR